MGVLPKIEANSITLVADRRDNGDMFVTCEAFPYYCAIVEADDWLAAITLLALTLQVNASAAARAA